jgi:hypothetical protein
MNHFNMIFARLPDSFSDAATFAQPWRAPRTVIEFYGVPSVPIQPPRPPDRLGDVSRTKMAK